MKQIYITLLLVVLLCGCTRRVSTAIERVRTDTFIVVQRDTVSVLQEVERIVERATSDTVHITERITHWVDAADSSTLRTDRECTHYVSKARDANTWQTSKVDTLVRQYRILKEKMERRDSIAATTHTQTAQPLTELRRTAQGFGLGALALVVAAAGFYFLIYHKKK